MRPSSSPPTWLISLLLASLAYPSLTTSTPTTISTSPSKPEPRSNSDPATCYYPNGTLETDPSYQPCPGPKGMCCATNRKDNPDVCLQNGLCQSTLETQDSKGETVLRYSYSRGQCTSRDWEGGGCLGVCVDGEASNISATMTPCDRTRNSTTWCCGDSTECCGTQDAITIAPVLGEHGVAVESSSISTSTSTTTSSPTSTSIPTTLSTTASPTTSIPTSTSSSKQPSNQSSASHIPGLSNEIKAGIGVAVSAAVLLLFVATAFLLRRHRRPKVVSESREVVGTPVPRDLPGRGVEGRNQSRGHGHGHGRGRGKEGYGYVREEDVGFEMVK